MIPDNVTLIVKAPNQQIEDQNIECQSSWTVRQLKSHLSEIYPNRPSVEEQKIIYSGRLLDDNTILKDVLRTYDSEIVHTMHLVCTPRRRAPEATTSTDGLRQRAVPPVQPTPEAVPRPEMRQNDQNHTVEMQNYLSSFVNNYGRVPPYPSNFRMGAQFMPAMNNETTEFANQVVMMQQAYFQYMQQYANMWQATHNAAAAAPAPAPPAPEPAPQPEDEDGARDWLDHLYSASRLAILFSLVYLYGSPARLLLVLLLVVAGYLHQIGFFRDLHVHHGNQRPLPNLNPPQANPAQPQPNAAQPQPNAAQPQPNAAQPEPSAAQGEPNAAQGEPNPPNANPEAENQPTEPVTPAPEVIEDQPSLLAVTWMIFTTFFASLVPDTN